MAAIGSEEWNLATANAAAGAYLNQAPTVARQESPDHWVSVAWERIDRLARRGKLPASDPHATRFAVRAGRLACIDRLRVDTGARLSWRPKVEQFEPERDRMLDLGQSRGLCPSEVPDPRGPTADERLLSLWCDTRSERRALVPMVRHRVWLYLWLVERWSQVEVSNYFGCEQSTVSQAIKSVARRVLSPDTVGELMLDLRACSRGLLS